MYIYIYYISVCVHYNRMCGSMWQSSLWPSKLSRYQKRRRPSRPCPSCRWTYELWLSNWAPAGAMKMMGKS